jgi:hypothetical protein
MRRLETTGDGWRFAVDVLRNLRKDGPEKCRANLPLPQGGQSDAMIMALMELKERGTTEACCGFGQVLTDALGTRTLEPMPELYQQMEREGRIRPYRLKRLVNYGHRIAVLALRREAEERDTGRLPPPGP